MAKSRRMVEPTPNGEGDERAGTGTGRPPRCTLPSAGKRGDGSCAATPTKRKAASASSPHFALAGGHEAAELLARAERKPDDAFAHVEALGERAIGAAAGRDASRRRARWPRRARGRAPTRRQHQAAAERAGRYGADRARCCRHPSAFRPSAMRAKLIGARARLGAARGGP